MISCGDLIRFTLPALSLTRICPSFDQQSLIRLLRLAHLAFHNIYCLVRVRSSVMKTLEGSTNHVRCGISTCRTAPPSVTSMKTSSPSPSFAWISPSSWEPPAPLPAAALASPEAVRGSSPCTMSGAVFVGRLAAVPSVHGVRGLRPPGRKVDLALNTEDLAPYVANLTSTGRGLLLPIFPTR